MIKKCRKCQIDKDSSAFHCNTKRKDGLKSYCIDCCNLDLKSYRKKNLAKVALTVRIFKEKNPNYHKQYLKQWKLDNPNYYSEYHKQWLTSNPGYKAEQKQKWLKDPRNKLIANLRSRLYIALKGETKLKTTLYSIGCTLEQLKVHIESQFQQDMTWNNWGKGEGKWNIDHKIPFAAAQSVEDIVALNHYSNLQPLWETENLSKGGRV